MEWESKVEMLQASKKGDFDKFKSIVLTNLDQFDGQAWDMFFNCTELLQDKMIDHKEFYITVLAAAKKDEEKIHKDTSFRSVMRYCLFSAIIEEGELFNP